jgi:hypothetical protein
MTPIQQFRLKAGSERNHKRARAFHYSAAAPRTAILFPGTRALVDAESFDKSAIACTRMVKKFKPFPKGYIFDQGQVENSVHTGALPGKVLRRDHAGRVG